MPVFRRPQQLPPQQTPSSGPNTGHAAGIGNAALALEAGQTTEDLLDSYLIDINTGTSMGASDLGRGGGGRDTAPDRNVGDRAATGTRT